MRTLNAITVVCILFFTLAACDRGSQRRLDRETFEQETRRREPRRIKEAEIIAAGMALGDKITYRLQESSQPDTVSCCPKVSAAVLDSLQKHYEARINCYTIPEESPAEAEPLERELLDAYRYNLEQQLPLEKNIQAYKKDYLIYTAPASNGGNTESTCAIWSIRLSRKQVVLEIM